MAALLATTHRPVTSLALCGALLMMASCLTERTTLKIETRSPTVTAAEAMDLPGLNNLVTYADGLLCGGVPEGGQGFATLERLGIQTIISVDGATPDVERAAGHGLRYVHLPISYDTISTERQEQLAQAIHNVQRPIYVHCHHGRHRSGAALATALVCTGGLTVAQAKERMHVSGTAASYTGLWAVVEASRPLSEQRLHRDPASFPSVTTVTGLVATMAEIDQILDLVRQSHRARWRAPADHPDLVAEKETERLAGLLRSLRDDAESQQYPAEYQEFLSRSIEVSQSLHGAVRDGNSIQAGQALASLRNSCKNCHRTYRNK